MGAEMKSSGISKDAKKLTAYHEVRSNIMKNDLYLKLIFFPGRARSCIPIHRRRNTASQGNL